MPPKKDKKPKPDSFEANPERVLRPIHDQLDVQNFRGALKSINTALDKFGAQHILLALKAFALVRCGDRDAALELAREVQRQAPTDDTVLSTLLIVFKALGALEDGVKCYESAVAADRGNENLCVALYFALGRTGNLQRQQQVAMQLYTTFRQDKYLFWSALVVQLMCHREHTLAADVPSAGPARAAAQAPPTWRLELAPAPVTPPHLTKLLALSEALTQRQLNTDEAKDKALEPELLLVLYRTLRFQGKFKEALALLTGPRASLWADELERPRTLADLYQRMDDYAAARDVLWKCLSQSLTRRDDFADLCAWMDAEWRAQTRAGTEPGAVLANVLVRLDELHVPEEKALVSSGRVAIRGPQLARVEAIARSVNMGLGAEAALADAILAYLSRFGDRSCFFSDVRVYCAMLGADEMARLVRQADAALREQLAAAGAVAPAVPDLSAVPSSLSMFISLAIKLCKSANGDSAAAKSIVQLTARVCSVQQLSDFARGDLSDVALRERARALAEAFWAAQRTLTKLAPSETALADALMHLSVHALVELHQRSGNPEQLREAVAQLYLAVAHNTASTLLRVLLMRLLCHEDVSAVRCAWVEFRAADIKQIQLEALLHLLLSDAVRLGLLQEAQALSAQLLEIHDAHRRDGPEMPVMAYRERNYSQVLDLLSFDLRMARSHMYARCHAEQLHCLLLGEGRAADEPIAARLEACVARARSGPLGAEWEAKGDGKLVYNEDFSVLDTSRRAPPSLLPLQLNRPSLPVRASSFFVEDPDFVVPLQGESVQVQPVDLAYLTLRKTAPVLLHKILAGARAEDIRKGVATLLDCMSTMRLLPPPAVDVSAAEGKVDVDLARPASSLALPLLRTHWRACFLAMELAASLSETLEFSLPLVEAIGDAPDDARMQHRLDEHQARWSAIARQLHVLTLVTTELSELLGKITSSGPEAAATAAAAAPPQPRVIPLLAIFSQHGAAWLPVLLSAWASAIPNRKRLRKMLRTTKKPESDPAQATSAAALRLEGSVAGVMEETRAQLGAAVASWKELLSRAAACARAWGAGSAEQGLKLLQPPAGAPAAAAPPAAAQLAHLHALAGWSASSDAGDAALTAAASRLEAANIAILDSQRTSCRAIAECLSQSLARTEAIHV